jgi:hypothetical protein
VQVRSYSAANLPAFSTVSLFSVSFVTVFPLSESIYTSVDNRKPVATRQVELSAFFQDQKMTWDTAPFFWGRQRDCYRECVGQLKETSGEPQVV